MKKFSVEEYLSLPESLQPMELVYGVVREPAAPRYGHQRVVTRLTTLLEQHVQERGLGVVCVSPLDVVLDKDLALVVQPDIIFVASAHVERINERIWGPPDLVVEVVSPRTAAWDRTTKLGWYTRYGVEECWLVDAAGVTIEVIATGHDPIRRATFLGDTPMTSAVLPEWRTSPAEILL